MVVSARTCSVTASIVEAVTTYQAHAFTWCLRGCLLYDEAVELYLKCMSYMYITFNSVVSLEHSTAIRSNLKQVIAELPIMLNLKSLLALIADPTLQGVVKSMSLASFQTMATKHVLRKIIQNIKKAVIYFRRPVHVRQ